MKPTLLELRRRKGTRLAMLTAYDFPSAKLAEGAGVDAILIGDSLGMVVLGYASTVPVTMDEMLHHAKAVRRGAPNTFLIADLPFLAYKTPEEAVHNAGRFLKEAGADAVKLEGGEEVVPMVEALTRAGIGVLGHVGLTPQTASTLGGFKRQGTDAEGARRALQGAIALDVAGSFGVVLELVPAELARLITERVQGLTIGIGAGGHCDGQVLVFHDAVGLFSGFKPSFVKRYAEAGEVIHAALAAYAREVREGTYPSEVHAFSMRPDILERLGA